MQTETSRRRKQRSVSAATAGSGSAEGVFDLKCPKLSWNLAKVTTHNVAATNVAVFAKFYNTGFRLILR